MSWIRARSIASNIQRPDKKGRCGSESHHDPTKAKRKRSLTNLAKVQALQLEIGGQADYEEQQVKVLDDLEEEYQHARISPRRNDQLNALSLFIHQSQDPKIRLLALP